MKKLVIISTAALLLGLSACAEQQTAPGTYESKSKKVDAAGTEYYSKSKTKVSVDEDGNRTVEVDKENSKDPKGLFNKSTTKSKKVIKTDPDNN
jgi:hypothetical protein